MILPRLLLPLALCFLCSLHAQLLNGVNFEGSDYDFEGCGKVGGGGRGSNRAKRAHSGVTGATKREIPWAVGIMRFSSETSYTMCGGTLISRRHVVSAAHCLVEGDLEYDRQLMTSFCDPKQTPNMTDYLRMTKVVVDGPCLREDDADCRADMVGRRVQVANVTLFAFFEKKCMEGHDLVVLTLAEEVASPHACLPWLHAALALPSVFPVAAFGWGESVHEVAAEDGTVKLDGNKEENLMKIIDLGDTDLKCKFDLFAMLHDVICVAEKVEAALCMGDSGAGLLTTQEERTFVLGVLSFGNKCKNLRKSRTESKFTDIRLYSAQIDKVIGISSEN